MTPSQYRIVQDAFEKARRIAGAEIGHAEALEQIAVEFLNAVHDESERDPSLTALDPDIERAGATSWSPPSRIGDRPMSSSNEERLERDRTFRLEALWQAGWRCVACGARCRLEVDHIRSRARHPRLRWDPSNRAVECSVCHGLKTSGILRIDPGVDGGPPRVSRPSKWNRPPERGP
jgi:5-methylcytosine-specific restriction endonuclease McrA